MVRVGLWENGRRVMWLDEQQVSKINSDDFASELASIFVDQASLEALPSGAAIGKPDGWQKSMDEIKETLNVPLVKI